MKKFKKVGIFFLFAVVIGTSIYSIQNLLTPKIHYSLKPPAGSIEEAILKSEMIVMGTPTGKVEYIKTNDRITFRLTEVQLERAVKGEMPKEKIMILQTDNFEPDVNLKKGQKYALLLEAYVPGEEKASGAFVIIDAFRGIYPVSDKNEVTAITLPEYEPDPAEAGKRAQAIYDICFKEN